MGLDIMVYKIRKTAPKNKSKEYFRLIDNDGHYKNDFPKWTKAFEKTKTETWFDFAKYKEQTGIDTDQLYVWEEYYGGLDNGYIMFYPKEIGDEEPDKDAPQDEVDKWIDKVEANLIKVMVKDVPTKKVKIKVLYREEIGYQRKGLNAKFYEEHKDACGDYIAWTKEELEHVLDVGCDEDHKSDYDRHYICTPKADFKENIIDPFVEGECCVWFNW